MFQESIVNREGFIIKDDDDEEEEKGKCPNRKPLLENAAPVGEREVSLEIETHHCKFARAVALHVSRINDVLRDVDERD